MLPVFDPVQEQIDLISNDLSNKALKFLLVGQPRACIIVNGHRILGNNDLFGLHIAGIKKRLGVHGDPADMLDLGANLQAMLL